MPRNSRRSRKGGDKLDDIQTQLNNIQQEVNELKSSPSSSMPQENTSSSSDFMSDYANEPSVTETASVPKPWQDNKDIKFADGNRGRVTLSFPRIIMLLDKNIKTGNTTKNWSSIKDQLLSASSTNEVNSIIKTSGMNFSGNSVSGGTKKRRRGGRKRTQKRR